MGDGGIRLWPRPVAYYYYLIAAPFCRWPLSFHKQITAEGGRRGRGYPLEEQRTLVWGLKNHVEMSYS